ncbi:MULTISPECIES: hypothetical protein [Lactobacillus]|uniref:hypothetical protein n=1 Tax=Lactobacillus TaxID=1578 RepID=UPI002490FEE9|nr:MULTISPECIES: hypothetical protein [Lactobacillus]
MKNKDYERYQELKKLGRKKTKNQRQEFIILKSTYEAEQAKKKLKETQNQYLINLAKCIIERWAEKNTSPKYLTQLTDQDEFDFINSEINNQKEKLMKNQSKKDSKNINNFETSNGLYNGGSRQPSQSNLLQKE